MYKAMVIGFTSEHQRVRDYSVLLPLCPPAISMKQYGLDTIFGDKHDLVLFAKYN
jgi:hypothetical protein